MSEERKERCETCRFFCSFEQEDELDGPDGSCRAHSPQRLPVLNLSGPERRVSTGWPSVCKNDWCGEALPHIDRPPQKSRIAPKVNYVHYFERCARVRH